MEEVKRSRKSRMKKRPDEWEQMKVEIAQELGLWEKVQQDGWSGLSAEDSGRLGGVFSARRKALLEMEQRDREDAARREQISEAATAEEVVKAENFPRRT